MKIQYLAAASVLALGMFATPAASQVTEGGPGSADDNTTVTNAANDFLDLLSYNKIGNGDDRDNIKNSSLDSVVKSNYAVAKQELNAININSHLDEVVDMDGKDESDTPVGYNSGNNYIRGNAFAAFAGISNNAWNTGINANTQAATNIAAVGQVSFGVGCCEAGNGNGGPD